MPQHGEIFVTQYQPLKSGVLGAWFCSICDQSITTNTHPDFDPRTAEKCPFCGNPNKVEKKN